MPYSWNMCGRSVRDASLLDYHLRKTSVRDRCFSVLTKCIYVSEMTRSTPLATTIELTAIRAGECIQKCCWIHNPIPHSICDGSSARLHWGIPHSQCRHPTYWGYIWITQRNSFLHRTGNKLPQTYRWKLVLQCAILPQSSPLSNRFPTPCYNTIANAKVVSRHRKHC